MKRGPLRCLTAAGALLLVGPAWATVVPPPFVDSARTVDPAVERATTWYVDAELILLLERQASTAVSVYRGEEASARAVDVSVAVDMRNRAITADFGPGFPAGGDVAARMLRPLAITLRFHAEQAGLPIRDVIFQDQGKPIRRYAPEDLAVGPKTEEMP
ncbi:hypothetical protein ACIGHF_00775 [Stenotrophomonas sp. NPDC077464]|uniref:hypothetical protein n=1 Tax=unclassified Stenotrophomonas TaxID=196198 RepID=UPI0037CFEFAB